MKLNIGIKSDPIEYRYSYDWLFTLLKRSEVSFMQLGSFFELYFLPDEYFHELRSNAERNNIQIKSCFTTHRELGGFFTGNHYFEKTARRNYERYIEVASILGADFMGSNPGAIHRDSLHIKKNGIECYLKHMKELMHYAHEKGLKGLTIEPMSCIAEPPAMPDEIEYMLNTLNEHHKAHEDTVPVYICGDISHGYADKDGRTLYNNYQLFEHQIPYMCEFHFKNTDRMFNSTFGFSKDDIKRGIVDLVKLKNIIERHRLEWPLPELTGYLEISGPKLGRDYSDCKLEGQIADSFENIFKAFAMPCVS